MAKVWEYKGYTIDEGLKPRDENFKSDHYQYFFIVKKGNERLMKFCVWAPRADLDDIPEVKKFVANGARPDEFVRAAGLQRVKAMIAAGSFKNVLLEITASGSRELALDDLPDKLR